MQTKRLKFKKLVIISSLGDKQSFIWSNLCRSIGIDLTHFHIEKYKTAWNICVSTSINSVFIKSQNEGTVYGVDEDICWYIRSINEGPSEFLSNLNLLHSILSLQAYPHGNYFFKGDEEGRLESKPLHATLFDVKYPNTNILNMQTKFQERKNNCIVKSISTRRSNVVNADDLRLKIPGSLRLSTPVMLQEKINGIPLKLHFYRKRCGVWMPFSISCRSYKVDYRFDSETVYRFVDTKPEWIYLANRVFEQFGCRFFDVDIIIGNSDLHFLEVNFSPAPTFFEEAVFGGLYSYSSKIIIDWLGC